MSKLQADQVSRRDVVDIIWVLSPNALSTTPPRNL